ncbi:hypothetical protein BC832DRAFT_547947 [Gaertneriomyces semiglobifer]|nr:hypothetical protein BC832DRAFT_547947 [Gaertneriomyces semiglobifer]
MPGIILKIAGYEDSAFSPFAQLDNGDDLARAWKTCTKVKDTLENGNRFENLSWRLWHLHQMLYRSQKSEDRNDFRKISTKATKKLEEADACNKIPKGRQVFSQSLVDVSGSSMAAAVVMPSEIAMHQPVYLAPVHLQRQHEHEEQQQQQLQPQQQGLSTPELERIFSSETCLSPFAYSEPLDASYSDSWLTSTSTASAFNHYPAEFYDGSVNANGYGFTHFQDHAGAIQTLSRELESTEDAVRMLTSSLPGTPTATHFNKDSITTLPFYLQSEQATPRQQHTQVQPQSSCESSVVREPQIFMRPAEQPQHPKAQVEMQHPTQPTRSRARPRAAKLPVPTPPAPRHRSTASTHAASGSPLCCENCQTTTTPLWRRSAADELLCNACGLYLRLHSTHRPKSLKNPSTETPVVPAECANCKTSVTPLWRRDNEGRTLCNACGLYYKLHQCMRPVSLRVDVVRKRQRFEGRKRGRQEDTPSAVTAPLSMTEAPADTTTLAMQPVAEAQQKPQQPHQQGLMQQSSSNSFQATAYANTYPNTANMYQQHMMMGQQRETSLMGVPPGLVMDGMITDPATVNPQVMMPRFFGGMMWM